MASRPEMQLWVRDYAKYRKLYRRNGPYPNYFAFKACCAILCCVSHL